MLEGKATNSAQMQLLSQRGWARRGEEDVVFRTRPGSMLLELSLASTAVQGIAVSFTPYLHARVNTVAPKTHLKVYLVT